ncbi:AAA family ATPase [Steroidobacter flavus]|uniref:AAA family ATPase n=1 Tax=Steroidobacter flavus TaxID=1842136 RepID=A0ABV8SZE8_9GAMM
MSLWWTRREDLDGQQVALIEDLALHEDFLILGPPGSGKTNVLLRRAQFVRMQDMPSVLVLTFTRPLVEFVRTGCVDDQNREIFPRSCVLTLESWIRDLYEQHDEELPQEPAGQDAFKRRKEALAQGALKFKAQGRLPKYDALFVDEVQDLYEPELKLLRQWSDVLFLAGDARQQIFDGPTGMAEAHRIVPAGNRKTLSFHYRLAPEICKMADKLLNATGADSLKSTSHYKGPKPGRIDVNGPMNRDAQLAQCAEKLKAQIRVYGDLIRQGDRLGVIVSRKDDREAVWQYLERDPELAGKSKIIRANDGTADDREYDPAFDPDHPISILTLKGCKGIEFRAMHWLFCERDSHHHTLELYYTMITRAKTSIDITYDGQLPQAIARSHSSSGKTLWQ